MGNFNKGKKFGGGGGGNNQFVGGGGQDYDGDRSGTKSYGGGRDRERREMFKATCSDCGRNCEVPFRPSGDKPVRCSDCFRSGGNDGPRNFRDSGNRDGGNKRFKPHSDNRRLQQNRAGGSNEDLRAMLNELNSKLEKILKLLNPDGFSETGKVKESKAGKYDKVPILVDSVALKKTIEKTIEKETPKKKVSKKLVSKKKTAKKASKKASTKKKKKL